MEDVLLVYLAVLNLVTFALYGADKCRAKKGQWRIPEKTLLILPLLGGQRGRHSGHGRVSPQDPALVFSVGSAGDAFIAGSRGRVPAGAVKR